MQRKKRERKIISLILVLALIFSMNITAIADEKGEGQEGLTLSESAKNISVNIAGKASDEDQDTDDDDDTDDASDDDEVVEVKCKTEIASENNGRPYEVSRHDSRGIESLYDNIRRQIRKYGFDTVSDDFTDDGYFMEEDEDEDRYKQFRRKTRINEYEYEDDDDDDDEDDDEDDEDDEDYGLESIGGRQERVLVGYRYKIPQNGAYDSRYPDPDDFLRRYQHDKNQSKFENYYSVSVSGGDLKIYIDPDELQDPEDELPDGSVSPMDNALEYDGDGDEETTEKDISELVELTPEATLSMNYEKRVKAYAVIDDYELYFARFDDYQYDYVTGGTADKKEYSYRLKFEPSEINIVLKPTVVSLQPEFDALPDPMNVPVSITSSGIARKLISHYKGLSFSQPENISEEDTGYIRENIIKNLQLRSSDCSFIYKEDYDNPMTCLAISVNSLSGNKKDEENIAYDKRGIHSFGLLWKPVTVKTDDGSSFSLFNSSMNLNLRSDPGTISSDAIVEVGGYTLRYPSHLPYIGGKYYKKILKNTNNIIYLISENGVPITGEPPAIKSISIKMGKGGADYAIIKKIKFVNGLKIKTKGKMRITVDKYYIDEYNASSVIEIPKTPKVKKGKIKGLRCSFSDITVNGTPLKVVKKSKKIKPKYAYYESGNQDGIRFSGPYEGEISGNAIKGLSLNSIKKA